MVQPFLRFMERIKQKCVKRIKKIRCALEAAKTAKNVGILPGGGVALLHASKELDKLHFPGSDEQLGVQMFQHALKMPVYSIASTAGLEGTTIVKKLMEQENPNIGYDSTTGEYVDMIQAGNMDPLMFVVEELLGLVK